MCKTRFRNLFSTLVNSIGLFAFVLSISLAGCAKNADPIIDSQRPTLTAAMATPSEYLKPTFTPEAEMMGITTPHVSPYIRVMVLNVEIRFLETNPVQVEIVIRGTLPDQCKYDFYSVENRGVQRVKVSLDGIHPTDMGCPQTIQDVEYVLLLGRDMPEAERGFSPGEYELVVNNYQSGFSIK